ncbi:50S ribosomal protein L11 methyltransferase, partial [Streptococcus agalactiae]
MNTWNELTVHVNREAEEAVSNLLIETGSQGVAISDSADYLGQEDRFGELYPEVEQSDMIAITAYYPDTLDIEAVKADLADRLANFEG